MAAFTIRPELPLVNISMAIGAFGADILENHAGMALGAAHLLVHAAQWIAGAVVVELGVGSNRFPTGIGMAILTRGSQWTMRVGHFGLRASHIWVRVVRWLLRRHANEQWKQRNR